MYGGFIVLVCMMLWWCRFLVVRVRIVGVLVVD